MTDLCKAAEMALEALKETIALCINYKSVEDTDGYQFTEANDVIKQGESAHNALRQALEQPEQEVSYTDIQMAELIMSDCGHSSDYKPLLDRIAGRLAKYRQALKQPDPVEEAVLAEREACAKACESIRPSKQEYDQRFYTACTLCANAIRARGE